MTRQTMERAPGSKIFQKLGGDRTLDRLPAVDKLIVFAHIAGELGERGEQAELIGKIVAYRKHQQPPSPASLDQRIEGEAREFREDTARTEAETRRYGRGDILDSQREAYLRGRVALAQDIFRLSCYKPYYSQFRVFHGFGPDRAVAQLLQLADSDGAPGLTILKNPNETERKMVYVLALEDLLALCENACVHQRLGALPEQERLDHVYLPALVHHIRMAAEYSDEKSLPIGHTLASVQGELGAKTAHVVSLVGEEHVPRAASAAVDICLSNGDYEQGIKIAQIREMAEQLAILRELKVLTGPDFVEIPHAPQAEPAQSPAQSVRLIAPHVYEIKTD
jgi:hypothetical protein